MKMPKTPFATRLSGGAKETELRLRSIFQWKKKRPPVVLLILAAVLLVGICGGLVGFSSTPRRGTFSELYPEYFAENAGVYIVYENKEDFGRAEPMPGSAEFAAAMEYLGGTELRAVWGRKNLIGEFDFRNGAFYLVSETEDPLKLELYPDGYVVVSTGHGQTENHDDAKVYRAESFDKEAFLNLWKPLETPETAAVAEKQLRLIAESVDMWAVSQEYANERYAYCVTDLDGNGRLELIASNYGGTGHYTYTRFYEVNEDGTALSRCDYETKFEHDAESEADVIEYTIDAYRSPLTGLTWYIFEDYGKWGGAEYPQVKLALQLNEGRVETNALAWKHSTFIEFGILERTTCADWQGTEWSDAEAEGAQKLYDTAADRYFIDQQKLSVTLGWMEVSPEEMRRKGEDELCSLLTASLLGFTAAEVDNPEVKPVAETEIDVDTLENLNLDGVGSNDDSLTVTTVRPHDWTESYAAMTVRLGTGQELEYTVMGRYFCNGVHTPYLTTMERQTIVLELAFWGANWAGCNDILFEVRDGVLTEVCTLSGDDAENALNTQSTLYGLEVIEREDSPLQALRVPTSVGKWHGPDIGTLTWEDDQWKFVLDGYYIDDWYWAVVDGGMELTISLRGRINWETPSYPIWYYDQIQILHGETVIQTITENSFMPDDHCPFDFFNADVPNRSVFVRDINFDGNDDFGVPCNRYHNDGYCWFLYDPQLRQFRYAFSLSGEPLLLSDQKQIVEKWQDDYGENITYNTYEYNKQGKLTLVESRKETE